MHQRRRSLASGRYVRATPSTKALLALSLSLVLMGHHQSGVASRLMERLTSPVSAQTLGVEPVTTWTVNGAPCSSDGSTWVCVTSDTTHTALATPLKAKPVVAPRVKSGRWSASQLAVASRVVAIAREEKYDRLSFLLALADCESSLDPANSNTKGNNPSWSKDRGLFMWNSHWQKDVSDTCAYNLDCATREAIKDLKAGRASQWMCTAIVEREGRLPRYKALLEQL